MRGAFRDCHERAKEKSPPDGNSDCKDFITTRLGDLHYNERNGHGQTTNRQPDILCVRYTNAARRFATSLAV